MNFNKFFRLMLVVILATTLFDVASGQVNLYQVGPYQYAQYNGIWYTVVDGKQGDLVDTQHLIVRLKDKSDIDRFDFVALALPRLVNVRGEFANGFYELEIPEGSNGFEMARRLEGTGKFDDVLFNIFLEVDVVPNDQYYGNQWNLPKVLMSNAWDISTGDNTIIVAVIDVGADYNHEDLIGNLWSGIGYDFYDNDPDPYPDDEARHGTAVAGILGAVTNNTIGVSGVAGGWGGAGGIRIMHLDAGFRWFDPALQRWRESISLSAATQATDYAAMNGARVINMSFSGGSFSPLQNAINNAVNTYGVIVIASAGNYNEGEPTTVRYPAAYSNVIAVGATIPSDNRKELNDGTENWWGSSYGSELDVMAPGVYIWTTDLTGSIGYSSGNYYDSFNGTSSAAPQVVGLAALILSINPSLTLQEVREIIRNSADKVPDMDGQNFHIEYGYGRINAYAALLSVLARNNQTVNQTATAYNNGRRIVRDGASYWHLVFSSGGQIFYRKRTPWGQWQPPIQLSNVNFNDFPCITMANNGAPYVSWQRVTGTNTYDIYFAMSLDNGDTWDIGDRYVVTSVSSTSNPLPVINSDNAGLRKFIVYRTSTGLKAHTTVTQFPYYVNWTQQSISINSYDSYPTLTYEGENFKTALSYQNANDGNIYYRYYGTNWSNPVNLSAIVPGVASHLTPSITNIPNNPQIHVAWKKLIGSGSSYYDHLIVHRRATNYYTWPNEWFGTYYERQEYPSITGLATNKVDMLFQTPPQFGNPYVYRMRFTGNYWGSPIYIGNNARYPSVSSGSTTANYVWTSGSTAPYTVIMGSGLSKETEADPKDYYLRSIALLDSSGNYIELKIYSLGFRLNDGTIQRMDYSREDLSSFNLTNTNAWDSLCITSLKVIPKQVSELLLDYSIEAKNISNVANINNDLTVEFNILDSRNNLLTSKPQNHSAVSNQINLIRKELTIPLNSINFTPLVTNIRASIKVKKITPKLGTFASLGHIFDYTSLASNDKTEDENTIIEAEVIKDLTIQNYPNPFNPITNITYTLPYQSSIKLVIYDIMGGEVKTFNIASQSPGYQTIIWDGRNEIGNSVSSGIYIYRISVKSLENNKTLVKTSKLMMLK